MTKEDIRTPIARRRTTIRTRRRRREGPAITWNQSKRSYISLRDKILKGNRRNRDP